MAHLSPEPWPVREPDDAELAGVAVQLVGESASPDVFPDGSPRYMEWHTDHSAQLKINIGRQLVSKIMTSGAHEGSKRRYRHITVVPGQGRNAARAATSIRRSAPRLYLPSRPAPRPRYQRPSNG